MSVRAHGALVEVEGLGVLLLGPSGVGKSECALELVRRGHQLVADDVAVLERNATGHLIGTSPETIRHYMELRGIGVVFVPDLFGAESVRERTEVALVCRLEPWRDSLDVERVGMERPIEPWDGVELPLFVLPTRPAASLATLVEVAVRDHQLRARGASAPDRLDAKLRGGGRRAG